MDLHAAPGFSLENSTAHSKQIAYFSMEIALSPQLPTYSGGLGVLAGDTLRSMADLELPVVAVTLVHRAGYFHQHLDAAGQQTESDVRWNPEVMLPEAGQVVAITIQGREVMIRAWRFDVVGVTGHIVPVFMLDTDMEQNDPWDRRLTDHLYGGDAHYRLCQEAVLGLGGGHLLEALGYKPAVFHMNEGHASLLALGLLEERMQNEPLTSASHEDVDWVRSRCVFTTHTPVPAGHDQFGLDQMYQVLGQDRAHALEHFGCLHNGLLNMTYIALRFARYVNGVAMQHGKVSQAMFPEYPIHAITNGVHAATWLSEEFQQLFDARVEGWRVDNSYFRSVTGIEPAEIASRASCRQAQADRRGRAAAPVSSCRRMCSRSALRAALQPTNAPACSSTIRSAWPRSPRPAAGCKLFMRARRIRRTTRARDSSARSSKRRSASTPAR